MPLTVLCAWCKMKSSLKWGEDTFSFFILVTKMDWLSNCPLYHVGFTSDLVSAKVIQHFNWFGLEIG